MIIIKIIPNILSDEGRTIKEVAYQRDKTLLEYLTESGINTTGQRIIIAGKNEKNLKRLLDNNDEIIITPEIKDPVTVGLIGSALLLGGSIVSGVTATVLTVAGSLALLYGSIKSYFDLQRTPSNGTSTGSFDEHSPTYSWDGIQTIQDVGVPIPIVYGEHKIGGNIINMFINTNKQMDLSYQAESVTNVVRNGYENSFTLTQTSYGIKFQVNANIYLAYLDPNTGIYYYRYVKYDIYYKLTSSETWTHWGSVGDNKLAKTKKTNTTTWVYNTAAWAVHIEVPAGIYDIKIVDTEQSGSVLGIINYFVDTYSKVQNVVTNETDNQVLNILLALCEGEIERIDDIKINENPINNFNEIDIARRYGTNDQSIINNFSDLENLYAVNSKLIQNTAYTYMTSDSDVEGFEIIFDLPLGLYTQNATTGQISAWEVNYKVEYKLHSGSEWTDLGIYTIKYASRTDIKKIFRKEGLTAGQYDIRITKTSTDSSTYNIGDLYIQNINEIKTDDLRYPNTALLGMKIIATDQLSGGIPNITCVVRGKKVNVPKIMYGESEVPWEDYYWDSATSQYKRFTDDAVCTWDGATYVDRWSANPVWCLKDLLLNTRYGLGNYITSDMINDTDFLNMSRYCEEKLDDGYNSYEKRHRLDIVIDGTGRALDLIVQLANVFNGFAYYSEGTIKLKIDRTEDPVQLFGMGNIIKDSFTQAWKSVKEIPNVIEVQFLNADNNYKQDTIAVIDETAIAAGDPIRKKSVRAFVTKTSYALRLGRYILNYAKYINRSISFKIGVDGIACQAGDIVSVSHDVPQWGFSGRVQANSTTTLIKLDRSVTIEAGTTYKVRVKFSNDTIEERTVSDGAGTYSELNVTVAFSQAPAAYDIYAFGATSKKDFRIVSIQRENNNEVQIGAIEYNANVYDDSAVVLPIATASALREDLPSVTNLILKERLVKLADGTIEDVIDVWFNKPTETDYHIKKYTAAHIYISDNDGASWIYKGETLTEHHMVIGGINDDNTYKVAVVSVDQLGREQNINNATQDTITIDGKSIPPNNVEGFSVRQDGDDLIFSWSPNADVDLYGYEIREGDTWDRGIIVATEILENSYRTSIFEFGEKRYMVKAIDTTGNYSLTETAKTIEIAEAINIEDCQNDDLDTFANGELGASTGAEPIIDSSGNQVVDSNQNEIVQSGVVGFEISTIQDDALLQDEDDNYITDEDNLYLTAWDIVDPYLKLRGNETVGYAEEGVYISEVVDLPLKLRVRIAILLNYDGEAVTYKLEIRTSDNNIDWSEWSTYAYGEYECKYFQVKLTIYNNDSTKIGRAWNLKSRETIKYVEDGDEDFEVIESAVINFNKTFYSKVRLYVIAQGSNYANITAKSLNSFTVEVREESTGDLTTGDIDWVAKGY